MKATAGAINTVSSWFTACPVATAPPLGLQGYMMCAGGVPPTLRDDIRPTLRGDIDSTLRDAGGMDTSDGKVMGSLAQVYLEKMPTSWWGTVTCSSLNRSIGNTGAR